MLAGVGVIVWIFYLGATWGPKPVDSGSRATAAVADSRLVEESKRLAREFEAIAAAREPNSEDLEILRQAIAAQRDYNLAARPTPQDRRRQEELETRLAHFQAKELAVDSQEAEEEADRLAEAGRTAEAVAQVQLALKLQRDINQRFGRTEFGNNPRETLLQQRLSSMEALPMHERSIELEKMAEKAIAEQNWLAARDLLTEARDFQVRINEEHRRSSYYDSGRPQQLATKIASLKVGETMSEIQNLQARAAEWGKAGEWAAAGELYQQALTLQNQINRDHPQSQFVSTERVRELEAARQTALSVPQAEELDAALAAARRALASGDFEAAKTALANGTKLVGRLFEEFPRSERLNHDVRLEVEFLALRAGDLGDLQAMLQENLRPIPGQANWKMSAVPVSQRLYARIMSGNPSQHLGLDLPVDSVTLSHAREFCRRASWILARPVQLPDREQFEAALGEWNPEVLAEASWHRGNSGGESKPVVSGTPNAHGFLHLAGNLRQWTREEGDGGKAWTAGLSYDEEVSRERLFQLINRGERNRTIGFRFVVGEGAATVSL